MNEQKEKSFLVECKEESVQIRNEMEAEKGLQAKRVLRFRLRNSKFWERLLEGLIFVLLLALISGCHTINGVGRDLSAWSSPYIEHQEK